MIEKERLVTIVGPDKVINEPQVLQAYSQDMSFVNPVRPACVVTPNKADEVQKIIQLANDTQTPLVPVSSGPPFPGRYRSRYRRGGYRRS